MRYLLKEIEKRLFKLLTKEKTEVEKQFEEGKKLSFFESLN
jgi:hypothetical protein